MSSVKSPSTPLPQRSSIETPLKCSRGSTSQSNTKATGTSIGGGCDGSSVAKDIVLSHYSVYTLSSLQDLLRPSAPSRIAAAARLVHMEEDVVGAMVSGERSASAAAPVITAGNTDSTSAVTNALSDYTSYAVAAAAKTSVKNTKGVGGESGTCTPTPDDSPAASTAYRGHAEVMPNDNTINTTTANATLVHQAIVPSQALLLECAKQLAGLLAQWRACNAAERRDAWGRPPPLPPSSSTASAANKNTTTGSGARHFPQQQQQQQPVRPSTERILQFMNVILWYCLSTSDNARLAYGGGRSHGTSGRATPVLTGTAVAISQQPQHQLAAVGGSLNVGHAGRSNFVGRSGSSNSDPPGASDWLGSRMSTSPASSDVGVPTTTIPDDQLAEHLFRPAVDAAVLLQDRPPLIGAASNTAGSSNGNANNKGAKEKGKKGGMHNEEEEADMGKELQTVALWMLAAVLVRFAEAPFNATVFLPVLFPQVVVRGSNGVAARHPILQPLLRGGGVQVQQQAQTPRNSKRNSAANEHKTPNDTSLRCGAAAALTALLHKLQPTLQYAEEPHPNRQAFVSLATQCGTMLLSLHESLYWGLENQENKSDTTNNSDNSAARPLAAANTALPLLSTYSVVVSVTPYNRCPRSRAVVLQTLQLPVIRNYLAHEAWAEYVPTTVLVSCIFKSESMCGTTAQLLSSNSDQAEKEEKCGSKVTEVHAGETAAAKSGYNGSFLSALLQHADTRVEVWRCMVPLSRLYPRMVHSEFDSLMAASVRVVSTLASWEAAEEAAEKAELEKMTADGGEDAQDGSTTLRNQMQQQQQQHGCGSLSLSTTPLLPAVPHYDPSNSSNDNNVKGNNQITFSASLLSRVRSPPATLPEALAECLRTWLHFMGYVWKSFDDNAWDPALSPERQQDRATLAQKQRIHTELLRPAMRLLRCGEEVRTMTLRCIAQISDDYLCTITDRTLSEELVAYVQTCIADPQPRVRGEALTTLGMWLWQYPSMDTFACVAIDNAVYALTMDPNAFVRTKAAFALSNITGRLPEGTCPTVRYSPDYIATLCATAMHAAVIDSESGVQGHGIRMMNHLLQVLDFEELISEVPEFEEGVAEGFLRVLLECLHATTRGNAKYDASNKNNNAVSSWYSAPREAKHRWNAACALGMGLARSEVFEAEPKYAVEAVEALCTAVVRDHIFKVRTQAAVALARIPVSCLCATYSAEDLTPKVVRSLCEALESAAATVNFRQYKEQGSLHDALHTALATMTTTAKPSVELDKVFSSYQKLLQKEQLL